jgi:hypothetical protein
VKIRVHPWQKKHPIRFHPWRNAPHSYLVPVHPWLKTATCRPGSRNSPASVARVAAIFYSAAKFQLIPTLPLPRLPGFCHVQSQSTDGSDP